MPNSPGSFPLTDRPWIEVIDTASVRRLVSLREVFAECSRLRALAGDLATQEFAILRLMLAVLHRAIDGPATTNAWRALLRDPTLPLTDIDSYLDDYRDRFDLLHQTTPFYQVANLHTAAGEITGLDRIIADVPSNTLYLTARLGPALGRITPAEAARWVVHCQAFDVSGIKSGAVGDPRVKGGRGFPIGPGFCGSLGGVFLAGQTLRETLLLNLIPYDTDYLDHGPEDLPVWERIPHGAAEEHESTRGPHGRVSLYTWQSRRIRLFSDETAITGALVCNGDRLIRDNLHRREPMTAWRRNPNREKATNQPLVYVPATHDPTRALWRSLDTLLPAATAPDRTDGASRRVPALAQWLASLQNTHQIDDTFRVTTRAVGIAYGTHQAVINQVYQDALTLSVRAFDAESDLRTAIVDSASDGEAAVGELRTLAKNLCRAAGGSGIDRNDAPAAAADRAAEQAYAALDQHFRTWLAALGPDADAAKARTHWQQTVRSVVLDIGATLVSQAGPAAWAGRSVKTGKGKDIYMTSSLADLWFRRAVSRVLPLAVTRDAVVDNAAQTEEVPA